MVNHLPGGTSSFIRCSSPLSERKTLFIGRFILASSHSILDASDYQLPLLFYPEYVNVDGSWIEIIHESVLGVYLLHLITHFHDLNLPGEILKNMSVVLSNTSAEVIVYGKHVSRVTCMFSITFESLLYVYTPLSLSLYLAPDPLPLYLLDPLSVSLSLSL